MFFIRVSLDCPVKCLKFFSHLGNVAVPDGGGLVQVLPLHPLGGQAATGDGGPAPKRLELCVHNLAVIINLSIVKY